MSAPSGLALSPVHARRLLWIAALLLVPVPLLIFTEAFVPTARLLELAGVVLITIFVEGSAGAAPAILGMFLVHALVYAILLWVACWLVTAAVARVAPRALGWVTFGLIAAAVTAGIATPLYHTPFQARTPYSTLFEVYQ